MLAHQDLQPEPQGPHEAWRLPLPVGAQLIRRLPSARSQSGAVGDRRLAQSENGQDQGRSVPSSQAWGWPWADSRLPEEGHRGSGRRVWWGSGGKDLGTVGSEEQPGRGGRVSVWLSPGSAEPPWGPSPLSDSACRAPSGVSLWESLGWDTGPAVMQTFPVHQVFTCSPPVQFPASLAPHLGLWG